MRTFLLLIFSLAHGFEFGLETTTNRLRTAFDTHATEQSREAAHRKRWTRGLSFYVGLGQLNWRLAAVGKFHGCVEGREQAEGQKKCGDCADRVPMNEW